MKNIHIIILFLAAVLSFVSCTEEPLGDYILSKESLYIDKPSDLKRLSANGGTAEWRISAGTKTSWKIDVQGDWYSVSTNTGTGNQTVTVTYNANNAVSERSSTISLRSTVVGYSCSVDANMSQDGAAPYITLGKDAVTLEAKSSYITISVESNLSAWYAAGSASWARLAPGSSNKEARIEVEENPLPESRTATFTFKESAFATATLATLTVTQLGRGIEFTINPESLEFDAATGLTKDITVTTNLSSWTAISSDASWLTVTPGTGKLTLKATENKTTAGRSATVTFKETTSSAAVLATLTVTQKGANVTFSINSGKWTSEAKGESKSISVETNLPSWTAVCSESWVTLNQTANSLVVTTAENTTIEQRTAKVTFKESASSSSVLATLEITQTAGAPYIKLAQESWTSKADGESKDISIETNLSSWTATSSESWLKATPKNSYNTIAIETSKNTADKSRTATVTFKQSASSTVLATLTVTQNAAGVVFTVNPTSWEFEAATGLTKDITVTTNLSSWTAISSDASWLTVTPGAGKLTLKATENKTTAGRSATVTFKESASSSTVLGTLTVTQKGAAPYITLSQLAWTSPAAQSSTTVTVTTNLSSWHASCPESWVQITPGSNSIQVTTAENTSTKDKRTATISFKESASSSTVLATLTITQDEAKPIVTLSQETWTSPAVQSSITVNVTTNLSSWHVVSSESWLKVAAKNSYKALELSADENTSLESRNATVTIYESASSYTALATLRVTQNAAGIAFTLERDSWTSTADGESINIGITTNLSSWTATSSQGWVKFTPSSSSIRIETEANTAVTQRTATVTFKESASSSTVLATLTVTQNAAGTVFTFNPTTWEFEAATGLIKDITVTTNLSSWTAISSDASWLTVTPGTGKLTLKATENKTTAGRSATVAFKESASSSTVLGTLIVTQKGAAPYITLSQSAWTSPAVQSSTTVNVTTNLSSWHAVSSESWLKVAAKNSYKALDLSADENTSLESRNATVTIYESASSYTALATLRVTQNAAGIAFTLERDSWTSTADGESINIGITTNLSSWTATSSQSWVKLTPSSSSIRIETEANTAATQRTATVAFKESASSSTVLGTMTVTQKGAAPYLNVNPASLECSAKAQALSKVTINTNISFQTEKSADWITFSIDGKEMTINVTANASATDRTGTIALTGQGGLKATVTIKQKGRDPWNVDADGYGEENEWNN